MAIEEFGQTAAGETVHRITLEGGGLTARIMTWGATLQELRLEGHAAPLTLGFPDFASYPASPYFGQTAGRHANRIAGGKFMLDNVAYQLECNERGVTHLHGGSAGIAKRIWTIDNHGSDHAVFSIIDPDGQSGYPGTLKIETRYELRPGGCMAITYTSVTDRPTLANIAHHSYFNLDGSDSILDHELMMAADHYLPVDADQIPTGEIRPVEGTDFDFRELRPIRRDGPDGQVPYDHNFCISAGREPVRTIALARSIRSGIAMELRSTEPGLQFYSGFKIKPSDPGLNGKPYGPYAGFCLETQSWPDSPNHAGFAGAVLRPGEKRVQHTEHVFISS
ncbi:MAG: galactose mutarotase [Hoeflea sp.]|uniref:aldose epimerase family protein n=1 Tax=Hoeflea sp. TaxID=1940281 RepID=UPI001D729401|nr:aldose epimerase family protein [Hoeflea sp.]MBU4528588.1 galactose mutarotase [Alphaproteobacteria bacterium]MBU4545607.1 galactose mutarotase [Alphaproteobacteria bacterium]MBU4552217.1 galactose mutarotase [Alphaproteobacteria bacterium]MBV1726191.1 galactose mutarotase [Hoeflea sp.]MBV1762382.1 galactose mutarotase [Hoeflea sp.]